MKTEGKSKNANGVGQKNHHTKCTEEQQCITVKASEHLDNREKQQYITVNASEHLDNREKQRCIPVMHLNARYH